MVCLGASKGGQMQRTITHRLPPAQPGLWARQSWRVRPGRRTFVAIVGAKVLAKRLLTMKFRPQRQRRALCQSAWSLANVQRF